MIELLQAPDHVAAYVLSGTLSEEDVDKVIADVEAKLDRHDRIGILADLTDFRDVTIRAGIKDMRYSFGKLFELQRFPKEAVITERQWLATLASISDPFIPFVAVRAFAPGEREAALSWVADIETEDRPPGNGPQS